MNILKDKKVLIGGVVLIILVVLMIGLFSFFKNRKDIIDMGDVMNEQASEKNEEQLQLHYMITRNTQWGTDFKTILESEAGNILDYKKNSYITCDYETVFGWRFLPTYLFDNGKLVSIIYEMDLTSEDTTTISLIHQDLAVNIHFIYENLYRENNKWVSGQERKYDTNLWSNAINEGRLTLQSIWNSSDEKVFLLTGKDSFFSFLNKNKERVVNPFSTFLVISDDYLKNGGTFSGLTKIVATEGASQSDIVEEEPPVVSENSIEIPSIVDNVGQ